MIDCFGCCYGEDEREEAEGGWECSASVSGVNIGSSGGIATHDGVYNRTPRFTEIIVSRADQAEPDSEVVDFGLCSEVSLLVSVRG